MVRYVDSPTTAVSTHIDGSPDAVWAFVSDIGLPARFSTEFQGAEWIDGSEAVGARFRGHSRHERVGSWSTVCSITAWEPPSALEWVVEDPDNPTARWRFDIVPSGTGTDLTMTATMGPGPSGVLNLIRKMPEKEEKIVANRLAEWEQNMRATIEGIRDLVEADAAV